MENRIIEQYKGFLNTFPLWEGTGPFNIVQFTLPPHPTTFPQENELLNSIPSLSRNFVLGKRMESFFSYTIRSSEEYHLILENLQIAQNKIIIGEIDFILGDNDLGDILHVELVYKFYVYDPALETEEERWIGPNRRDSLVRKIKRLKEHQFPLIKKEETTNTLTSLQIKSKELKQMVCFKANLFVPWEMLGKAFTLINNHCIVGYWLHLDEFDHQNFSRNLFFIPGKQDWPIHPQANLEWLPYSMIYEKVIKFHENQFSPFIWMKTLTGRYERFFVVWW